MAVSSALLAQLRGGPCRVYSSDLRVRVRATGLATYPDVTVACGEAHPESASTVVNPRVVVEVLSDATEAYDRGQKLDHYRQIPSLAAVVIVSHRAPFDRDLGARIRRRLAPQRVRSRTGRCPRDRP